MMITSFADPSAFPALSSPSDCLPTSCDLDIGAQPAGLQSERIERAPQRPDYRILSEGISAFFVGRNCDGFWVARDFRAGAGGIFLLQRSAERFARATSRPAPCAVILLSERLELDVDNKGNQLISWFVLLKRWIAKVRADH